MRGRRLRCHVTGAPVASSSRTLRNTTRFEALAYPLLSTCMESYLSLKLTSSSYAFAVCRSKLRAYASRVFVWNFPMLICVKKEIVEANLWYASQKCVARSHYEWLKGLFMPNVSHLEKLSVLDAEIIHCIISCDTQEGLPTHKVWAKLHFHLIVVCASAFSFIQFLLFTSIGTDWSVCFVGIHCWV